MNTTLDIEPHTFVGAAGASSQSVDMENVATILLGGGQGTRLYPLTMTRCKPAISFGGVYRLIDVALSNAINSHCQKIYVVTQFLSSSLHKHICNTYHNASVFTNGFIDLLTAEQKPSRDSSCTNNWFQGTADAVRQNLYYLAEASADYFLILSGDQLYKMNFQKMVRCAIDTDADVVIAALPVDQKDAKRMGILKVDDNNGITTFVEKPQQNEQLLALKQSNLAGSSTLLTEEKAWLGSMGIYLFKRQVLFDLLACDSRDDFGKHLLPYALAHKKVCAYIHNGYWEDIGTIESFYNANMALTQPIPPFNLYEEQYPLYQSAMKLPGAKIFDTAVKQSVICDGCYVQAKEVEGAILGPRTVVGKGSVIRHSYIMGSDFYAPPIKHSRFPDQLGMGRNVLIEKAIVDKDVCIGNDVKLINKDKLNEYDGQGIYIRDGIIIVSRGASIPDGFIL